MSYEDPDPIPKGKAMGLVVFSGKTNRLLMIDCDSAEACANHQRLVADYHLVTSSIETVSKSGVGRHYYYLLTMDMTKVERVHAQKLLGSDFTRESLALEKRGLWEEPCYLFETPAEAVRVRKWLALFGLQHAEET